MLKETRIRRGTKLSIIASIPILWIVLNYVHIVCLPIEINMFKLRNQNDGYSGKIFQYFSIKLDVYGTMVRGPRHLTLGDYYHQIPTDKSAEEIRCVFDDI